MLSTYVQSSHVGDGEGFEGRQPEPEGRPDDSVDLIDGRYTLVKAAQGLAEARTAVDWQRSRGSCERESGPCPLVAAGLWPGIRRTRRSPLRDDLSTPDPLGRVEEVNYRSLLGLLTNAASLSIGNEDVLLAMTVSLDVAAEICSRVACFTPQSSKTASTTRPAPATAAVNEFRRHDPYESVQRRLVHHSGVDIATDAALEVIEPASRRVRRRIAHAHATARLRQDERNPGAHESPGR